MKDLDIEDFIENYPHLSNQEVAYTYGLKLDQVKYLGKKYGLKKTRDAKSSASGKIVLTKDQEDFLRSNWDKMTNRQLAKALGLNLTTTRSRLYALGLKRMEMEYFTEEMEDFLRDNYREIGDVEMAEMFEEIYPKKKPWTEKHIRRGCHGQQIG